MTHAKLEQAHARAALMRAHSARLAGEAELALVQLLAAWSCVRDRELADAIDMLTAESSERRPPVTDESQWLYRAQRADDPVEVGRLLTKCPRRPSLLLPGLDALMAGPPDPRLASLAMRRQELEIWLLGLPAMRPHLDPVYHSTLTQLGPTQSSPERRAAMAASVDDLETLMSLRTCSLDAGGQAVLEAVLHADPMPVLEDAGELALLVELAARPHELGPRSVYADYLLARGPHAHAQFVVLQLRACDGPLAAPALARMEELLRTHERAWLGKLATWLPPEQVEWRGGFGTRATARSLAHGGGHLTPREETWLADHPGLRTFSELWGASESFALELGA